MSERTTLTLDPDNAVRLRRLQKKRDVSWKELANDVLRRGLDLAEKPVPAEKEEFKLPVLNLGKPNFNTPEELRELMYQIQEEEDIEKLKRSGYSFDK